jgi:hypothetical protein
LIRREGLELRWEDVERDFVVLISTREGQNVTSGGTPKEKAFKIDKIFSSINIFT